MAIYWNGYNQVRISLVSWPPSEPLDGDLITTTWDLVTLADIPANNGEKLVLDGISNDMAFDVTVTGSRSIRMTCVCERTLPDPHKLGAASLAWRFLDANYARLWLIGNKPRALYPAFMQQRRQMVDELVPSIRRTWLWLSMTRCEPLFATVASASSKSVELLDAIGQDDFEVIAREEFRQLSLQLRGTTPGSRGASSDLNLDDLANLLNQAANAAIDGSTTNSVDLMAYSTERLFDALILVDRAGMSFTQDGLAAAEDIAWFDDCVQLRRLGNHALPSITKNSQQSASRLAAFCAEHRLVA